MTIPFVDLKAQYLSIKSEIDKAISNTLENTSFIGGKPVLEFEKTFAEMYGVKHVISCANGTDSLYILMKMLEIGTGDEVITVANSWISSSETISQTGATPVFIDIHPDYYSMDEKLLENKINSKTKAVIAVHLQGQMCEIDTIKNICDKHNIHLIEDCAQSHFSEFKGVKAGLTGIAGSFSFYPGKNLGAYGDAGCIITNNDALAKQCKMFANHGALVKHQHQIEGINSRLDGLQAAILSAKLPFIKQWTEARINVANTYIKLLKDIPEITIPSIRPNSKHSFHLFVIRAKRRNELMEFLKSNYVECALHYPTPLPFLECYKKYNYTPDHFPVSYQLKDEILSLPIYPELTEEQIIFLTDLIRKFYS